MAKSSNYQKTFEERGTDHQNHYDCITSTIFQLVNVIFSEEMVTDYKLANDRKSQTNFEKG